MAQLVSPGVSVTVVDESAYASPGSGTIPLLIVATAQDKVDPTGVETDGIAAYTKKAAAGQIVQVTSQRELTQYFGEPTFATGEGMETSEYGLLAAYSYLGQGSLAYLVRADVDLNELEPSYTPPAGPANAYQVWVDTDDSSYGLHMFDASSSSWILQNVNLEVALSALGSEVADPSSYSPVTTPGDIGEILVVILNDGLNGASIGYFYSVGSAWTPVSSGNVANLPGDTVTFDAHYNSPASPVDGDIWVKTTSPGNGLNLTIYQSDGDGVFTLLEVDGVSNDNGTTYVLQDGSSLDDVTNSMTPGYFALNANAAEGGLQIERVTETGPEALLSEEIYAQSNEPAGVPTEGTLWYHPSTTLLDIFINDGLTGWQRIGQDNITYSTVQPILPPTDNDIWVETDSSSEEFPKIWRWDDGASQWILHDNTDQTTERGVLFDDFTVNDSSVTGVTADSTTTTTDSAHPSVDLTGAVGDLLADAPDYRLYPADMLAVNMPLSNATVRVWREGMLLAAGGTVDGWVNAVTNYANGAGVFGRRAQHKVIATAMQAAVAGNDDLRDPFNNFTLMLAPNFPELTDELITLNADRGETAFIIIDTPMRKTPAEATTWVLGQGADENGEDGLVSKNTYSAVYYPPARSTTPAGDTVTVPASHVALYTYAYNDNIAYPWFAPAGLTRGIVQNGSAVGYITDEEEFKAISLSQGQRDAMYLNKLNPIANFPLEGVVIFGQKTLHPFSSALDRVNVARLVCYLRERFDEIARPLLFEPNDKLTRDRAVQLFETFLSDLLTKRALYDFAVVCDESNNTPIRIDRNELYIDVAIAPVKAVEFIYIPIRIVNTGAL